MSRSIQYVAINDSNLNVTGLGRIIQDEALGMWGEVLHKGRWVTANSICDMCFGGSTLDDFITAEEANKIAQDMGFSLMTESEWLKCTHPTQMLGFLGGKASDRKLRLFACACVRQCWHLLTDERSRRVVDVAERFADGLVNLDECSRGAAIVASDVRVDSEDNMDWAAVCCSSPEWSLTEYVVPRVLKLTEEAGLIEPTQAALLHDLIGNPFRPVTLEAAWLTSTVKLLTQAAYDKRVQPAGTLEPERLAILADALEDGGCSDPPILEHLRGPGLHFRGCFVLDCILDKE